MIGLALVLQALTIASPGLHTLTADVVSTDAGSAVAITANAVTLDLGGYTVRCAPPNPLTDNTIGISAYGRSDITIKNGSVKGCWMGVQGTFGTRITLEDLDLSENRYIGAQLADGHDNVIRRVQCHRIGGYTLDAYAICINGIGVNGLVEDSHLGTLYRQSGVAAVGEGVGLLVRAGETNVTARRNTIRNSRVETGSIAFWFGDGSSGTVTENVIENFDRPIAAYASAFVVASNNTVTTTANGTITLGTTTVAPGGTISFTVVNVDPPGVMDWVALTPASGADNSYVDWWYLNGSKTAPSTGLMEAALTFVAPTTPGTYNIRLYANNSLAVKLATSPTITVGTAPPTESIPIKVCIGTPQVCYEGTLPKVSP